MGSERRGRSGGRARVGLGLVAGIVGLALAGLPSVVVAQDGGRPIRIGYVSPQTGALAPFAEADEYILAGVQEAFADGIEVAGTTHPVEIITKDSQSDPNRAAEVANELIL